MSEEIKRVETSRGKAWASGEVKWRWVAAPRLEVVFVGLGWSGDVVGVGGLLDAIEWRRLVRGSYEEVSVVAILAPGVPPALELYR